MIYDKNMQNRREYIIYFFKKIQKVFIKIPKKEIMYSFWEGI
jgi:hypothetical protein